MPRANGRFETAAAFLAGAVTAICVQITYGWWLNSGIGVLRTSVVLFAMGFLIALARSESPWRKAAALWAGAFGGMTGVLFWSGPGTIWPIVLGFAAAITAASIFAGSWAGFAARSRGR
jgi:hypothetical protein